MHHLGPDQGITTSWLTPHPVSEAVRQEQDRAYRAEHLRLLQSGEMKPRVIRRLTVNAAGAVTGQTIRGNWSSPKRVYGVVRSKPMRAPKLVGVIGRHRTARCEARPGFARPATPVRGGPDDDPGESDPEPSSGDAVAQAAEHVAELFPLRELTHQRFLIATKPFVYGMPDQEAELVRLAVARALVGGAR